MNISKLSTLLSILLALTSTALAASAQQPPPPPTSAGNSPSSSTPATETRPAGITRGSETRLVGDARTSEMCPVGTTCGSGWGSSATSQNQDVISACSATADELRATRTLVSLLETENTALKQRLETEQRITALLTELDQTRAREADALRQTIASQSETIHAKDTALAAQDKLIAELRRKKPSPWKRVMDVLVGVGIGVVLR